MQHTQRSHHNFVSRSMSSLRFLAPCKRCHQVRCTLYMVYQTAPPKERRRQNKAACAAPRRAQHTVLAECTSTPVEALAFSPPGPKLSKAASGIHKESICDTILKPGPPCPPPQQEPRGFKRSRAFTVQHVGQHYSAAGKEKGKLQSSYVSASCIRHIEAVMQRDVHGVPNFIMLLPRHSPLVCPCLLHH